MVRKESKRRKMFIMKIVMKPKLVFLCLLALFVLAGCEKDLPESTLPGKYSMSEAEAVAFGGKTDGQVDSGAEEIYKLSENRLSQLRNRSIGFVFQKFYLLPFLTAYENILLPKSLPGNTVSEGFVSDVIQHLMLEDRLDHLPHELSGGQQQRVAIARALINQPKVIFADEPTGNLDKNTSTEVIGYLRECAKLFEQTVFLVTHDRSIIEEEDVVYSMDDGFLSQESIMESNRR